MPLLGDDIDNKRSATDVVDEVDDVVEGDDDGDVRWSAVAVSVNGGVDVADGESVALDQAVLEYFSREAERQEKRGRRKSSEESPARARRGAFELDEPARQAINRFLSHFGPSTALSELSPKGVEGFQEIIGGNTTDLESRLRPVKEFLRYCAEQMYTTKPGLDADGQQVEIKHNLGNYLRIKRSTSGQRAAAGFTHEAADTFEMTPQGLQALQLELNGAQAEMPAAIQAVAAAREDKDIRENAPLEAAREYQERLKARIDELEYRIAHAVVRERGNSDLARIGSHVEVVEVDETGAVVGEPREYTLVGTTEANAAERKISTESPLGAGLVNQSVGQQVVIDAPSGRKQFRLLAVD